MFWKLSLKLNSIAPYGNYKKKEQADISSCLSEGNKKESLINTHSWKTSEDKRYSMRMFSEWLLCDGTLRSGGGIPTNALKEELLPQFKEEEPKIQRS